MLPNTLSPDEIRALIRGGHRDFTIRYAGSPLPLTTIQAVDVIAELHADSDLRRRLVERLRGDFLPS